MRSGDPARTAFGLNEGTARLDELLRTSRKVTKSPRIATIGKMMFSAVRNMALIPPEASSDPRRLLVACQTLTTHAFVASTHRAPHYNAQPKAEPLSFLCVSARPTRSALSFRTTRLLLSTLSYIRRFRETAVCRTGQSRCGRWLRIGTAATPRVDLADEPCGYPASFA